MTKRECEEIQKSMDELFAADDPGEAGEKLLDHIERCSDCAAHFELVGRLKTEDVYPNPADAEFLAMRRAVLREIRRADSRGASLMDRLRALFASPAFALGLAVVMLGGGFLAGRGLTARAARGGATAPVAASGQDAIVRQIQLAAVNNRQLADLENSPFTYANVQVDDAGAGKVGLSFDVSRHVDVVLPKTDPLVSDVLVQSLVSQAPVGTKLRAISYTSGLMEPMVREALVRTMLSDSNLGVRLRAQTKLVEQSGDPEVEKAMLSVLQKEESVQMKLTAIDYLATSKVSPALLEQAVAPEGGELKRDAVYVRAMEYVNSK